MSGRSSGEAGGRLRSIESHTDEKMQGHATRCDTDGYTDAGGRNGAKSNGQDEDNGHDGGDEVSSQVDTGASRPE